MPATPTILLALSAATAAATAPVTPPTAAPAATPPAVARPAPDPPPPMLLELEVVATPLPARPSADPSAAGSLVGRARLDEPQAELSDVLDELPGVRSTEDGSLGGFATTTIRGATAQQTQVYLDGVPLNQGQSGMANVAAIPLGHVEAVEVYRGSTPRGYGAAAIGGVVDVRTARPRERRLDVGASVGSFGTVEASAGAAAPWGERGAAAAGLALHRTDGDFAYRDDRGTAFDLTDDTTRRRANNDGERLDALVRGGGAWGGVRLSAIDAVYAFRGGIAGNGLRPPTVARRQDLRNVAQLRAEVPELGPPGWALDARAYHAFQRSRQQDPRAEFGVLPNDTDDRTSAPGGRLGYGGPVSGPLHWHHALSLDHERFDPHDDARDEPLPDARRLTAALTSEPRLQWPAARLTVLGAATAVATRAEMLGQSLFGDATGTIAPVARQHVDGRLGLSWAPWAPLALKLNAGRAHREPSFVELFGDSGLVIPSPGLDPESAWSGDLGAVLDWALPAGYVVGELFGFGRRVDNLIQFRQASNDAFVAQNFDAAVLWGVEAAGQVDLWRHVRLGGAYTWLHTRQISAAPSRDGKSLPLRPERQWRLRPELYVRHLGVVDRLHGYVEVEAQAANYVDAANLVRIPARGMVHVGGGLRVLDQRLAVQATVRNATDRAVVDLVGFPLPGRSFMLSLDAQIL